MICRKEFQGYQAVGLGTKEAATTRRAYLEAVWQFAAFCAELTGYRCPGVLTFAVFSSS